MTSVHAVEEPIEVRLQGLLSDTLRLEDVLTRFATVFGSASYVEELVIFFKYRRDMRLRITTHGADFIIKERIAPHSYLRSSKTTPIPLHAVPTFVRQLAALGFTDGLFSASRQFTYRNDDATLRVKIGDITGRYFAITKLIYDSSDESSARERLDQLLRLIRATPCSSETFSQRMTELWSEVVSEPLLSDGGDLNHKIAAVLSVGLHSNVRPNRETLKTVLARRSNDYSVAERAFETITRRQLVSQSPINYRNAFLKTASIIVPVYNAAHATLPLTVDSIAAQELTSRQRSMTEVVIVDDGSDGLDVDVRLRLAKETLENAGFSTNVVRLYNNQGRATARNVGINLAQGDVVFFIDSDIILEAHYIRECMVRHQFVDKLVLVGFKQNLQPGEYESTDVTAMPQFTSDFRFGRLCSSEWLGLYPVSTDTMVSCVEETGYFKSFGLGRVVGPFDLPCMVVTHSVSAMKAEVLAAGCFARAFVKWGLEDTYLGARLIANGNYIVPLTSSAVFHMSLPGEDDAAAKSRKYLQLGDNYAKYFELLTEPLGQSHSGAEQRL